MAGDRGCVLGREGWVLLAVCLYCVVDPTLSLLSVCFDFNAYDIFSCQNLFIFFKLN